MASEHSTLSDTEWQRAHAMLSGWRSTAQGEWACPRCNDVRLEIFDQSARPHAEWYQMVCRACSLDITLQLPLAPHRGG